MTAIESVSIQNGVTVQTCARNEFNEEDFRHSVDQFKDVLVLPISTLEALFDTGWTTGYVTISTPKGDEDIRVYALTFADEYDATASGRPKAYLRDTVRRQLDTDDPTPDVVVHPVDVSDTGPLNIVRHSTAAESAEPNACRFHPTILSSIGCSDGDEIELYNPDRGNRFIGIARSERALAPGQVSLSTRARKLLRAEFPERATDGETTVIRAREPIPCHKQSRSIFWRLRAVGKRLLDEAVNYNNVKLRVIIGLNADEGRGTGRVNADTMDTLAIDDGDRVQITTKDTQTSARLRQITPESHLIETDEDIAATDVRDRTILLPSTVRQDLDAVCGDTVSVRRDTRHIAIHQLTISVFAFLGVFIGGLQTVDILAPPQYQVHGLFLTLGLCLSAVWLLLWPERERCR